MPSFGHRSFNDFKDLTQMVQDGRDLFHIAIENILFRDSILALVKPNVVQTKLPRARKGHNHPGPCGPKYAL